MNTFVKEWGLSGRGLAKACQSARVPVPPRGYWVKAQHAQHVCRPPLRDGVDAGPTEIVVHLPPKIPEAR
jgi:hypothetical protein